MLGNFNCKYIFSVKSFDIFPFLHFFKLLIKNLFIFDSGIWIPSYLSIFSIILFLLFALLSEKSKGVIFIIKK